jgi:hypothetical protein
MSSTRSPIKSYSRPGYQGFVHLCEGSPCSAKCSVRSKVKSKLCLLSNVQQLKDPMSSYPSPMSLPYGFCLMASALWLLSYGFCLMASVLWLLPYGFCLMSSVLWLLPYGFCLMASALWLLSYGLTVFKVKQYCERYDLADVYIKSQVILESF